MIGKIFIKNNIAHWKENNLSPVIILEMSSDSFKYRLLKTHRHEIGQQSKTLFTEG